MFESRFDRALLTDCKPCEAGRSKQAKNFMKRHVYLIFIFVLATSCISRNEMRTGLAKSSEYYSEEMRIRFFEVYPSFRIYVTEGKDERKIYPLIKKRILSPASFSDKYAEPYILSAYDSAYSKVVDPGFNGKIFYIRGVEFVQEEDSVKVNITTEQRLSHLIVYCFKFRKSQNMTIEKQLKEMSEL